MELDEAVSAARTNRNSTLTTIRRDGRPQLSNVIHTVDDNGLIRISTTAGRAKARNLARDPWAALHVNGPDFFSYAVLEGEAELSDVAASVDDAVVAELVDLYRDAVGEHDDWDNYRRAMIDEQRLVIRFRPSRAYGALGGLPPASGS